MLVDAEAADIIVTDAFTGIRNSMLRPSIVAAGLDPDNIPPSARGTIDFDDPHNGAKACRDIWSAGTGVGAIRRGEPHPDHVQRDRKSPVKGETVPLPVDTGRGR